MSIEEKLDEFIKQSNANHQAGLRRANRERYEDLAYISWGFALATVSLAVTRISLTATIASIVISIAFVVIGWVKWAQSKKWR